MSSTLLLKKLEEDGTDILYEAEKQGLTRDVLLMSKALQIDGESILWIDKPTSHQVSLAIMSKRSFPSCVKVLYDDKKLVFDPSVYDLALQQSDKSEPEFQHLLQWYIETGYRVRDKRKRGKAPQLIEMRCFDAYRNYIEENGLCPVSDYEI